MGTQYETAPITEALIDIRVESLPASSLPILEAVHETVKESYPEKQPLFRIVGSFSLGGGGTGAASNQTPVGFSFRSEDHKQVFQARLDGFTFSRLRPYTNWIELRDEARRLWNVYRSAGSDPKILRVAVRYINQVDIPLIEFDFKDYLRTIPEVSPSLPQQLSAFFMQLWMPQSSFDGMLILTQSTAAPSTPGKNSVILDLDVFKDGADFSSDDEVWELLETLRDKKNEFFEGSLTDKARELFGEKRTY